MAERGSTSIGSSVLGHHGATSHGVTLQQLTIAAAWNIQGNILHAPFAAAVRERFGIALPRRANTFLRGNGLIALWLGPSSWLLVAGDRAPRVDFEADRDLLNAQRGALFELSASRVAWRLGGAQAATVLNKGCPLDFDPRLFGADACAQSLFGHVNALFYRDAPDTISMMVARSFERELWHFLGSAAAQYGYDVLAPAAIG